ncbi:serpentine type 7TM GPCR chemoreceptor srt domain-containing protein [Ditylenchus destructor]|uniref:Serpentine type 7TM GPCR chemoreceptor srt domain-containing protein n=1 Tax=Ditylenchus destructor TaxID=166010 RepID=A0AAD4MZX4_9BILA|nr:serpentine type 7TM GPCR chemoreceptor srt domain-containing protein [Ditylenchus destructor]
MNAADIPAPKNDFWQWPNWNYTSYYDVYCTNGVTIPGERNLLMGSFYVAEYFVYLCLYIPSLVVIRRSYLFQHACYKLMFCIGIFDLMGGFIYAFLAGIFSLTGANYCDNNYVIILAGHGAHLAWGLFCSSGVVLALNRCIEVYSKNRADTLFGGHRVMDWLCFLNSCWVMSSLVVLYSLLLYGMWRYRATSTAKRQLREMQKRVMLQSFFICFSVFLVAAAYAAASFIRIPSQLGKFATMALQLCSGAWGLFCSSAVILALNRCIDVYSKNAAEKLFGGNRVWFWAAPVLFYAAMFSSDYDVPPIYNSVWSCYLFQIDFRSGSPPVLLQSCVICFSVFMVAAAYAIASFVRIPNELGKFATIALQLCSGTTSIVYLTMNNTIRRGVKELLGLKKKTGVTSPTSMAFVKVTTTQSTQAEKSQIDLDLCV